MKPPSSEDFTEPPLLQTIPHLLPPPQLPLPPFPIITFNPSIRNLFKILDLNPTSCHRELDLAYRRLVTEYYPDKWTISKTFSHDESTEKFKEITNPYEELKLILNIYSPPQYLLPPPPPNLQMRI